jgi:HSP20 family protein
MAIVRWESFRDLLAMQHRMDRLFNELGREVPSFRVEAASLSRWAPAADVYETGDNIVVKADTRRGPERPGGPPRRQYAFLKGERKLEKEVKEENCHRIERSYGSFTRSFTLPSSVDADKTSAEYKDGVLTLTMPREKRRSIRPLRSRRAENQSRWLQLHTSKGHSQTPE